MDLSSNNFLEPSSLFSSQVGATLDGKNGVCKNSIKNPFLDSFSDPLCKLNLKETSEFVKSFPGTESRGFLGISPQVGGGGGVVGSVTRRNVEAPPTPGRPIFSFSNGSFSRKNFPSKWDDAEKWLVSGSSCQDSPSNMYSKQCSGYKLSMVDHHHHQVYAEKSRVITEEKVSKGPLVAINGDFSVEPSVTEDVLLKDKFPNEMNPTSPKFGCSDPMQESFLFENSFKKPVTPNAASEMLHEVEHRDIGTEMTPLGSSTTSRCPTPFKSTSPARHNTPANRSGPLALVYGAIDDSSNTIDITTQLQEYHLAKLHFGTTQFDSVMSNWSSREEEEEDVSKSLRHFEMSGDCRRSVSESRANCAWEEEEKTKSCLRYQREEAKIQAWVNLQSAKAEAESRKLEVKIQKMRSNFEEKMMKRMADVHRKAEEWKAVAQFQHSEQIRKVEQQGRKAINRKNNSHFSGHKSCGCFPCNNHHI